MTHASHARALAVASALVATGALPAHAQLVGSSPAEGYTIHVTAPHLHQGRETEPVHHYCKPATDDPIIVCLLYNTDESDAPLHGVEYIVAKSLTRPHVSRGTWNSNFHDHALEIATGRVQVLDMPAADARGVAELVATTDGLIFHLWPDGDPFPTGTVVIDQAVGHRHLTEEQYRASGGGASGMNHD